ncbi:hypothetical protein JRQ81_009700 [Phrynocephalus forsythii]|uniref:PABS domain-containing protein n=1 Tax=Phrynocephalus forsythii TaxID=171643 RepID=A0A9Q0X8N0_9SAUR|nr:hypothetical protein JRQ81_009700 [Phrynocephalus forsythii]
MGDGDPSSPAESLFKESYYQLMKTALREDGILCCQGECQWLHLDLIKEMRQFCKSLFPVVEYAYCTIPTYPSGQIGFMLCSKNPSTNFREPVQALSQERVDQMNLKYYNSEIHRAAFVLPEFARKELTRARKDLILKMLADLLDGAEVSRRDTTAFSDSEDLPESKLEGEPSELEQLSQITQRDRKAPCKNFFWKTFTAC